MAHHDPLPPQNQNRRIQIRGLLWLALLVMIFAVARAGLHTAFPQGWWRLW
jgi:hypothetical protein